MLSLTPRRDEMEFTTLREIFLLKEIPNLSKFMVLPDAASISEIMFLRHGASETKVLQEWTLSSAKGR